MSADWQAIQREYEQGISQHSLAAKYGISQPAISQYAKSHGWLITPVIIPQNPIISDNSELVDQALADLALHLTDDPAQAKLELKEHKLFADAFSQYMKVKLLFPSAEVPQDGLVIPFDHLSARARMEIQRILLEDESRKERAG